MKNVVYNLVTYWFAALVGGDRKIWSKRVLMANVTPENVRDAMNLFAFCLIIVRLTAAAANRFEKHLSARGEANEEKH